MYRFSKAQRAALLGSASSFVFAVSALADPPPTGGIETVVVTAEKRAEDVQNVPAAVTALSGNDLKSERIDDASQLYLAVPNLFFSRAAFGSNDYSIRGVGVQSTSATADPGITVHENNAPVVVDRSSDADFFDVDRIETLRGPQGTQFGRNATGGVINIITQQPTQTLDAQVTGEYGAFNDRKLTGFVNVPFDGMFALRIAGEYLGRDGDVKNLLDNHDIDSRNLWSGRATLSFDPSSQVHMSLMWQRFGEADSRTDEGRTLCQNDPGPATIGGVTVTDPSERNNLSLGCTRASVYGPTVFGVSNAFAGLSGAFAGRFGLLNPAVDGNAGIVTSHDLRDVEDFVDPENDVRNDLAQFDAEWSPIPEAKLISLTSWTRDDQRNLFDTTTWLDGETFNPNKNGDLNGTAVSVTNASGVFDDPQIGSTNRNVTEQLWGFHAQQWSQEVRLESSLDGPVNFSVGGIYIDLHKFDNFVTMTNVQTALSEVISTAANPIPIDTTSMPNPLAPQTLGHNYFPFISPYTLTSKAAFGEVYWDILSNLRFTGGVRYTDDVKDFTVYQSTFFKTAPASLTYGTPGYTGYPCPSNSPLYSAAQLLCPFVNTGTSDAFTGKASLDWAPELDFTDETHVYASFSRGYKAGGFNPATLAGLPPTAYAPEFIDSFEVGTKNTLLQDTLLLNLTGFHYNYQGYQISVFTAAATLTSNVNAHVDGIEGEAVWQPDDAFKFNADVGLLSTGVANGPNSSQVDLINPTQGNPNYTVVKTGSGQCVVPTAVVAHIIGQQNISATGNYSPNAIRFGVTGSPTNPAGLCASPGGYAADFAAEGYSTSSVIQNGLSVNLIGHELPDAPGLTLSFGAQYTWHVLDGWNLTPRLDFHVQGAAYSRLFNLDTDRIRAYTNLNGTIAMANVEDGWLIQMFGKNLLNSTQITNFGPASITFGDTTAVSLQPPREIGISVTKSF